MTTSSLPNLQGGKNLVRVPSEANAKACLEAPEWHPSERLMFFYGHFATKLDVLLPINPVRLPASRMLPVVIISF
jgi:hypothetical protein